MSTIVENWHNFLLELTLAQNYHHAQAIAGVGNLPRRDPVLDQLLPSLLYVKMVAIVDESLAEIIDDRGVRMPANFRNDLNGRVSFLHDEGVIADPGELHRVRHERNRLAHDAREYVTWATLTKDSEIVEAELLLISPLGPRGNYEFFGERSRAEDSPDPDIAFRRRIRYGVKLNGEPHLEISYVDEFHRMGQR